MTIERAGTKYSEQDIMNYGFSDVFQRLQVMPVMQDPSRTANSAYRVQKVNGGLPEVRMAYDSDDNMEYAGLTHPGTATDDVQWLIWKLTWTDGNCTRVQNATGSWDNRESLF